MVNSVVSQIRSSGFTDMGLPDTSKPRAQAGSGKKDSEMLAVRKHDPIGTALRRLHDEIVAEPLPDDFLALLDRIDAKRDR